MPEFHSPEDQAALYVLGELADDEHREFKARLAESAELRALVRELEDGAVALALASPKRLPPRKVWQQIEKAVAGETRRNILTLPFPGRWWRNGWAAAAACLIGWLLYALWAAHPAATAPPPLAASENHDASEHAPTLPAPRTPEEPGRATIAAAPTHRLLQADAREITDLRTQIAGLESNLARLSQSVAQQQALLGESNRLKFVQFRPAAGGDVPAPAVNLSPDLQRALALAMARELGWAQSTDASPGIESNSTGAPSVVTISNVDFVDLRPTTNGVSPAYQSQPQPQTQSQPQPDNQSALIPAQPAPAEPSPPSIPAFISGQSLVMAIDATIAAKNSQVTFSYQTPDQGQVSLGTATLGDNPMVITVPLNFGGYYTTPTGWSSGYAVASGSLLGWGAPITATISTGGSNTFQYFTPQSASP